MANYISNHQKRNDRKGGGVPTYIHFKTDISHHFICFLQPPFTPNEENKVTYITTIVININAIEMFKHELCKTDWDDVINNKNLNDAYNYFLHKLVLYDQYFPK